MRWLLSTAETTHPLLLRIIAPWFVAAIEVNYPNPNRCAPMLFYMNDWSPERIRKYCKGRNWRVEEL